MLKLVYAAAFTLITVVAAGMMVYGVVRSCPAAVALSAFALIVGAAWVGWFMGSRQVEHLREMMHYEVIHYNDLMNTMSKYNKLKGRVHRLYTAQAARVHRTGPQKVLGRGYRQVERALP